MEPRVTQKKMTGMENGSKGKSRRLFWFTDITLFEKLKTKQKPSA